MWQGGRRQWADADAAHRSAERDQGAPRPPPVASSCDGPAALGGSPRVAGAGPPERAGDAATEGLREPRLERAIGVIYRPETERVSHYFGARIPDQFDAVLHFDETRAVEPLEYTAEWEAGEPPETFPFGV